MQIAGQVILMFAVFEIFFFFFQNGFVSILTVQVPFCAYWNHSPSVYRGSDFFLYVLFLDFVTFHTEHSFITVLFIAQSTYFF